MWKDFNQNGVQDVGEPGVSGAEVQLLVSGLDEQLSDTCGAKTQGVEVQTTDGDGKYLFVLVPPGEYTVKMTALTLPRGYQFAPSEGYTLVGDGLRSSLTVAPGQGKLTIDAGVVGVHVRTGPDGGHWPYTLPCAAPSPPPWALE